LKRSDFPEASPQPFCFVQLNLKLTRDNFIQSLWNNSGNSRAYEGRKKMRFRSPAFLAALAISILCMSAFADQIMLKDGTQYSGKFVRGDERTIFFKILDRIESFKIANVEQIIFKEPELRNPPRISSAPAPSAPEIPDRAESIGPEPPEKAPAAPPPARPIDRTESMADSDSAMIFPKGTPVVIRTTTAIDTDRNRVGDIFEGTLEDAIVWGNQTIFPRGTTVKGRIAYAQESGKLTGQSQLVLELTDIVANGRSYFIRTSDYTEMGSSRGKRTAATAGGVAALGAIIGGIAGGGKGAAIGAASGAAVGTGVTAVTRGEILKVPAETVLEFKLQTALKVER
jgi:hypothetical protein